MCNRRKTKQVSSIIKQVKESIIYQVAVYFNAIVKTPTTTSIQLKTTSTAVGFDMIMTLHHHHHPRQELYLTSAEIIW